MSNINTNTIKLMNAGGREKIIGDVPDLWHIAMAVSEGKEIFLNQEASERILEVWHMAHDLKDAITEDRGAKIISIT